MRACCFGARFVFSGFQYEFTGAGGTIDISYKVSNDGENFYAPVGLTSTLATGLTPGAGYYYFQPGMGQFIKLIVTETAGNPITLNGWWAFQ